jgi:NAD(P)-dependent dehydrogenase (short-subunit alcohol dehydrogenase family)
MDLASIEKFATEIKHNYTQLNVLLNNAGIMSTPYFTTNDGLEAQNGTNHYGHFALTGQLMDLIKATPKSRVVNVSSMAHKWGKMDFNNPLFENGKGYTPMKSYSRSKLSNLLFTYELQRWFDTHKIDAMALATHPGISKTNLDRYMRTKISFKLLMPLAKLITQSQDWGALPQIRAAADPAVKPAEYYGPHRGMKGYPVVVESNNASHSMEDAKKLWELSEAITKVTFK